MARKVNGFLLMICLLFAAEANAMSGNDWRGLTQGEQASYVVGVIDAWLLVRTMELTLREDRPSAPFWSLHSPVVGMVSNVITCLNADVTYEQRIAIINRHMERNPDKWHNNMAMLVWDALDQACPKSK